MLKTEREKLLVVTSSFPRWPGDDAVGGGSFVLALSERLAASFDVTVLVPGADGALSKEQVGSLTVHRHQQCFCPRINLAYGSGIPANLRRSPWLMLIFPFYLGFLLQAIRRLVRDMNIGIIHAHWLFPSGLAAVLYKWLWNRQVQVLITTHGSDVLQFNGGIGRWLKRLVLTHADAVTALNPPLGDSVRELGYAGPLNVCPMGVDTTAFSPERRSMASSEGGRYLLFVGSIIRRKGIELLIDAMPAVLKVAPHLNLVVIGEGHDKERMADKVRQLGITSHVHFAGVIPHAQLPAWFAGAEALVLPSYSEGFPVVVMEALSSGIIPIVSPLPVFTAMHAADPDPVLVLMRDWTSAAVAEAIVDVISHPERMSLMRGRCRAFAVRHLDWEVVAGHYRDILGRLSKCHDSH